MFQGNKLQDELMRKDEAKIQRKREANEQRRLRIMNAKVRIIGLDVDALDAQVAEKKQNHANKLESDRFEKAQAMEIDRLLTASLEEERQMKEYQMHTMKQNWADAANERNRVKNAPKGRDFDPDNCGSASLQKFSGEDENRIQRLKLQKDQMRKWIQEQIAEKSYLNKIRKDDDMTYAEMIKAIDDIRAATEKEEIEMRKYIQDSYKRSNLDLAKTQKARINDWNKMNINSATSLTAFDEDKGLAMDENGRIIRVDMFKGFTDEQKRRIFQDNQDLIRHNNAVKDGERRQDFDWALQQEMSLRAMELAEYEEKCMRDAQKEERLAYLRQQIEHQNNAKYDWKKTKYGEIGSQFFESFGRDCR